MSRVHPQCHSCGRIKGPGHVCPRICDKCSREYAAKYCPKCFGWLNGPEADLPPPIDRGG